MIADEALRMKPLTWVGFGFALLAFSSPIHGYDVYADWVGWLLVLVGVHRLPGDYPFRGGLTYLGVLALLTAAALWVPQVLDALDDADESLAWAANLPHFGAAALLCLAVSRAAGEAGDVDDGKKGSAWWRTLYAVCLIVIALPVLVFGAGLDQLSGIGGFTVSLLIVVLPITCFVHAGRSWAGRPTEQEPAEKKSD